MVNIQNRFKTLLPSAALALGSLIVTVAGCSAPTVENQVAVPVYNNLAPTALKVGEGFQQPLGYYEATPRFSWQVNSLSTGKAQTAYQIQVATSPTGFTAPDLWDSQKVTSSTTSWLKYQGKALSSRQQVFWRVRIWDENQKASAWSSSQRIELGLLNNSDWQAQWIGHPDTAEDKKPSQALNATPQYLRTTFNIKADQSDIAKARLYITAKGLFKPFVNGKEVAGNDVMTPGWTPYAKRIETLTYDVTKQLQTGENALAASIAGGWYSGRIASLTDKEHLVAPRLLAQLEITYQNGQTQMVVSNSNWKASQNGPIRFANNYDGESYDQSFEMPGWNSANFNDANWATATTEALDAKVKLSPKRHAPIRNTATLPTLELIEPKKGIAIFDSGQNMAGVPVLNIPVIKGQKVTIRYAEALHKGEFYTKNYRTAKSTDYFTPSKTGMITYKPTFTYHGYRYVELSGFDASKPVQKSWVTNLVQHSDVELFANFTSSHAKLNKLASNIVWGLRGNFYDIPLDCPQRDERLGWTGDAQVFVTPSMYMADVYGFWSAWLESVREDQQADGKIPLYIPFIKWLNFASSGWGDAVTIIPWELYQLTGDSTILADNYQMMRGWLNYHESQMKGDISKMMTFGDWLQPYPVATGKRKNRGDTNFSLISTAFYAQSLQLTIKSAQVLGKTADIPAMEAQLAKLKQAVRDKFYDDNVKPSTGVETQTSYLLPLAFGLFNEADHKIAFGHLLEQLKKADNHLRTGFLGTPLLIEVLHKQGRDDLVYELIFKETYPSWFYSINNGATTTWERWNSYTLKDGFNSEGMNSLNHYAYGTVSRYFYEGILGIKPTEAGFKRFKVAPKFNEQLNQASGSYLTPNGEIKVAWGTTQAQLTLELTVPKNSLADIDLPQVELMTMSINGVPVTTAAQLSSLTPGQYKLTANLPTLH